MEPQPNTRKVARRLVTAALAMNFVAMSLVAVMLVSLNIRMSREAERAAHRATASAQEAEAAVDRLDAAIRCSQATIISVLKSLAIEAGLAARGIRMPNTHGLDCKTRLLKPVPQAGDSDSVDSQPGPGRPQQPAPRSNPPGRPKPQPSPEPHPSPSPSICIPFLGCV